MSKTIKKIMKLFIKCFINVSAFASLCYLQLRGFVLMNTNIWWVGAIMIITALSAAATQAVWMTRKM